jgi:tryptophan halogenase
MRGRPSDAFRALVEREGIVVEFGQGAEDGAIALSDRVTLPLETAKRLVLALNEPLARHAPRLRAAEAAAARGHAPVNAPADPAGARAAELMQRVAELGIPYRQERSFRLSAAGLLANRFLLTLSRADARALEVCRALGMPERLRRLAEEKFAMAACLHLGFEGAPGSILCKLYLERAVPAQPAGPALLHLAFKWDLVTAAEVVTEYVWHPLPDAAAIEARLASLYADAEASLAIARDTLALAVQRVPAERLQYLEVLEENGRRSFDLNLYDAGLQVKDLLPLIHRMRSHFGIPPGRVQALYDQIKGERLGHLAGGVHRNGRDFFNVYYGVR